MPPGRFVVGILSPHPVLAIFLLALDTGGKAVELGLATPLAPVAEPTVGQLPLIFWADSRGVAMIFDWRAGLFLFVLVIALTWVSKLLAFRVPALERERLKNREADKAKLALAKYPPVVKAGRWVGATSNLVFFAAVAPFCVTLAPQPWWRIPLDIFAVLMIYDLFYYLMHRFLFHGQGRFRRIHALHHQARSPTYIDAHYVHPLETFLGLNLFLWLIPALALAWGPFHATAIGLAYVIYVQLNIINHCAVDLPHFPFKTLNWITTKHATHHRSMHMGNYATITLLYDKLFGTLD